MRTLLAISACATLTLACGHTPDATHPTSAAPDAGSGGGSDPAGSDPADLALPASPGDLAVALHVKTVFVIVMENHNWSSIKGSKDAPYLNQTLLPKTSHAEAYMNPPGNHPSEPNYLWLEAGGNLGVTADDPPAMNHQATTDHLVSQLEKAGVSWMAYEEDLPSGCPLTDDNLYAVRHNPMVFFDDVTDGQSATSQHCMSHMRSLAQLFDDLAGKNGGAVARYNFITPNLCSDGHGQPFGNTCLQYTANLVKLSDDFLAKTVPLIEASPAFLDGGALFITWDEGEGFGNLSSDGPIGMIVDSPLGKGGGYSNTIAYTHSSTLRSIETVFGVPLLRDAQNATDLSDLFHSFP